MVSFERREPGLPMAVYRLQISPRTAELFECECTPVGTAAAPANSAVTVRVCLVSQKEEISSPVLLTGELGGLRWSRHFFRQIVITRRILFNLVSFERQEPGLPRAVDRFQLSPRTAELFECECTPVGTAAAPANSPATV